MLRCSLLCWCIFLNNIYIEEAWNPWHQDPMSFELVDLVYSDIRRVKTLRWTIASTRLVVWDGQVTSLRPRTLKKEIDVEKDYTFLPYSHTPHGIRHFNSMRKTSKKYSWVLGRTCLLKWFSCSRWWPLLSFWGSWRRRWVSLATIQKGEETVWLGSWFYNNLWRDFLNIHGSESRFRGEGRDKILPDLSTFLFEGERG